MSFSVVFYGHLSWFCLYVSGRFSFTPLPQTKTWPLESWQTGLQHNPSKWINSRHGATGAPLPLVVKRVSQSAADVAVSPSSRHAGLPRMKR